MAISKQSVLTKMINEMEQAVATNNEESIREHVHAVRLLCDLILDDTEATPKAKPQIYTEKKVEQVVKAKPSINHEEANGNSIFDF